MDTAEKKKPVRPHWMEMYKEADQARDELDAEVAELHRVAAVEVERFNEKCKSANDEIDFLRGVITELTATLRDAVKARE